jgi:hypothetical protein
MRSSGTALRSLLWTHPGLKAATHLQGLTMIRSLVLSLALLGSLAAHAPAFAQSVSRAQFQMDRDTFLATFRWDELSSQWVMKEGLPMPKGIKSRDEVMGMAMDHLKNHRWDELNSEWVPISGKPREMSTLTRDQVHMETVRFLMTHRFDEANGQWVSKMRGR